MPYGVDVFVWLFAESVARAVVAVPPSTEIGFLSLCSEHGCPVTRLGVVGGEILAVDGQFSVSLDELREAWSSTLPALFD